MNNQEEQKYPKRPRIGYFSYKGHFAYFITICTDFKKVIFVSEEQVELVLEILKQTSKKHDFNVYAYCFMPDHLHLLLLAEESGSSLKDFLREFKQKSSFYYKKKFGIKLWQPSYYDHVLRKNEKLNNIAEYIFFNPVRKKLVDDYRKYPYLGSFIFDVKQFLN